MFGGYTIKRHCKALLEIAKEGSWRGSCPANSKEFGEMKHPFIGSPRYLTNNCDSYECELCHEFISIPHRDSCPCGSLGEEEAIKRTLEALRALGYKI